ncbi:BQ2448_7677 [Microbotryum intermedium]|uniref:BQ2448_7677 protein n=1 Tax=Microbotryum intermedium TaxID=269621 RepID=A0A238FTU7_9BASI|nr:BQ2448_7677 [Microbotryum intermedium]
MLMQGLNVLSMVTLASLLPTLAFADQPVAEDCTHSISKLEDVADALRCKHITLGGFSVTTRQTLNLELRPGATVEMTGDLNFDNYKGQSTPMIILKGANITFNGNNHNIRCNGDKYWPKTTGKLTFAVPAPVMSVFASGIMQNFTVFNSPRQAFFIGNIGRLKIKNVNVDNTAGKGRAANTDGFDIKAKGPLEISGCTIDTQDDCFAISGGNDTSIHDNKCVCTHGISIGSVQTGYVIRNTYIGFNTLQSPVNALRIKAMLNAKDGIVENVTYEGNIAFNVSENGFMLVQNYTNDNKHGQRPTNGVLINKVHFISENTLYLDSGARPLNVVCAPEACPNEPMGLENVKFIGGGASVVVNAPVSSSNLLS